MKASVFVGVSVDGFIARPDGAFDFLSIGGVGPEGFDEFLATVDALVMGRKTYEVVLKLATWPYGEKPVYVLSHHDLPTPPSGISVEQMSGEPEDIVARLTARGIGHIYVDGGITIQRFLRAGLIQHLTVTHVPVLIGEGIALFGPLQRDIVLRLISSREFPGGAVRSEYAIDT